MEISLCMIVKDEQDVLGRCLESVAPYMDEIIIVDTGSTDKTVDIAKKFNASIHFFEWCDDFARARNYAFSKANKEYIMWLDADDYLSAENQGKLLSLKKDMTDDVDIISMIYSLTRDENGKTTYSLRRNRIVRKDKNYKWIGRVHEYLDAKGTTFNSDIEIFHHKQKEYSNRNLKIYEQMKKDGEPFSSRDIFYYANELYDNKLFEDAISSYREYIEKGAGWIEDLKTATVKLVMCLKIVGRSEESISAIVNSMTWDKPHPELCCRAGEYFMEKNKYEAAVFWYESALKCSPKKDYLSIVVKDYFTFIPAIQLCVCYSYLGQYREAWYYNELAASYRPNSPLVQHNRNFLKDKIGEVMLDG